MSKAEELARKYCEGSSFGDACIEKPAYIAGYHQAEKDLALRSVDIKKICLIAREVHKYYGFWSDIVYQEVLNRFKDLKHVK